MSKVLQEWLYVGDLQHAIQYRKQYTFVVSLLEMNPWIDQENCYWVEMQDRKGENIEKLECAVEMLWKIVKSMDLEKDKILVHCRMGISRSVTVAVEFIAQFCKVDIHHALRMVRIARNIAKPNAGFMKYLLEKDQRRKQELNLFPMKISFQQESSNLVARRLKNALMNTPDGIIYWLNIVIKKFCVYGSGDVDEENLQRSIHIFEQIEDMFKAEQFQNGNEIYLLEIIRMLILDEFFFQVLIDHCNQNSQNLVSWALGLNSFDEELNVPWCITMSRLIANICWMSQKSLKELAEPQEILKLLNIICTKVVLNCKCIKQESESSYKFALEGLYAVSGIMEYYNT
jgi:hypothetical protein